VASKENEIIRRYFNKESDRDDVLIGVGDDAATVRLPSGMELVSAIDTIVEGVHFPAHFDPGDIGYRALAVNLSDFAAMGAEPAWALLSLSLPAADESWLGSFSDGFFGLAGRYNVALIGGDLIRGPMTATVTVLGHVPAGMAITRAGAQAGDLVYVTGSPGAAALGLAKLTNPNAQDSGLEQFFRRPQPRVQQGIALRGIATAMIDISDGLLTDAGHIAMASGVRINFDYDALMKISRGELTAAFCGGDDYEILFTVPEKKLDALNAATAGWTCGPGCIGKIEPGQGLIMPGHDLAAYSGYDHFA